MDRMKDSRIILIAAAILLLWWMAGRLYRFTRWALKEVWQLSLSDVRAREKRQRAGGHRRA